MPRPSNWRYSAPAIADLLAQSERDAVDRARAQIQDQERVHLSLEFQRGAHRFEPGERQSNWIPQELYLSDASATESIQELLLAKGRKPIRDTQNQWIRFRVRSKSIDDMRREEVCKPPSDGPCLPLRSTISLVRKPTPQDRDRIPSKEMVSSDSRSRRPREAQAFARAVGRAARQYGKSTLSRIDDVVQAGPPCGRRTRERFERTLEGRSNRFCCARPLYSHTSICIAISTTASCQPRGSDPTSIAATCGLARHRAQRHIRLRGLAQLANEHYSIEPAKRQAGGKLAPRF